MTLKMLKICCFVVLCYGSQDELGFSPKNYRETVVKLNYRESVVIPGEMVVKLNYRELLNQRFGRNGC